MLEKDNTLKLLTIGNSFSQNACQYLGELAKAGGHKILLGHADIGGCPFDKHLEIAGLAEANPDNINGKPYGQDWPVIPGKDLGRKSLKEMLMLEEWDIITIQQYSWISDDYSTYQPHAGNLCAYIKLYAPNAEIVIHETWAYRCDDPRYTSDNDSREKMYVKLRNAYQRLASDLVLRMIPVGDAFYVVDNIPAWSYKPAASKSAFPELPDQTHSLHYGWYWTKNEHGENELQMDGHHASALGCYLAGCVWYEFLFNNNVENLTYVPPEISAVDAVIMRKAAHEIVRL